jgi:hypothetical protein
MVRYSHVRLCIPCTIEEAPHISSQLGLEPSQVVNSQFWSRQHDGTMKENIQYTWALNFPMSAEQGDPTARLGALIELIRPFSDRLLALDQSWKRWIDILFHVTPQRSSSILGEFDWFCVPSPMMKELGAWDLSISYEMMWFNHPDWKPPHRPWWRWFRKPAKNGI